MIPVLVVVPTFRRPEKLAACLAALRAQTHTDLTIVPVEDTRAEFAFGIWNRHACSVKEGAFAYLCDDMDASPTMIEAAVAELLGPFPDTDGLVGFYQNIHGKKGTCDGAVGLIGAKFLDRFAGRRPFCPDYRRFYADLELGKLAKKLGRFRTAKTATLVHHHPQHEPAAMDATHKRVREPVAVEMDRQMYRRRHRAGLLWGESAKLLARGRPLNSRG